MVSFLDPALSRLMKSLAGRKASVFPGRKRPRLLVEVLENRLAPASIFSWVGPQNGGNWSNPLNWEDENTNNGVPGQADTALFNNGNNNPATIDANFAGTVGEIKL